MYRKLREQNRHERDIGHKYAYLDGVASCMHRFHAKVSVSGSLKTLAL